MGNVDGTKSTQKLPKHDSFASSTQDSYSGQSSKPYNNTDAGRGKSRGGSDPDGGAPAANRTTYTSNSKRSGY